MLQIRIVDSVPLVVIDSVQDADQRAVALAQQAIQTAAHFFSRYFARIARADSGDDVGIDDAGLQAAHLAVELHSAGCEIIRGQVGQRVPGGGKKALVGEVVDRQANSRCGPLPRQLSVMVNEQRGWTGLPIVQVHHLRLPIQMQRQMRGGLGEENEALRVVRIIDALLLIQIGALIKRRLVHEIHRQPRDRLQAPGLAAHAARAQREIQGQIRVA